jgi:LPXTG-motif cell wall-anchored protein
MNKRGRIAIIAGAVLATGTIGFAAIPALADDKPDAPYNVVLQESHQGSEAEDFTRDCAEVGDIGDSKDGWVFNAPSNEFDKVVGVKATFDDGTSEIETFIRTGDADAYPDGFANAANPHLAWVVVPHGWELVTAQAKLTVKAGGKGNDKLKLVVTHTCAGKDTPPPASSPSASPRPEPSVFPSPSPSPVASLSPSAEASVAPSPEVSASASPEASPSADVTPQPEESPSPETSPSPEASASPETSPEPEQSPEPSSSPEVGTSPSAETGTSPSPQVSGSPQVDPSHSDTPSVSASPSPETGTLPRTGAPLAGIALAGVALVGLGAVVLVMSRRRREHIA